MTSSELVFTAINGVLLGLVGIFVAQGFFGSRNLGARVWSAPWHPVRYATGIWLLLIVMDLFRLATPLGGIPPALRYTPIALYSLSALITWFPVSLVRMHEKGLRAGLIAIAWEDLNGWAWQRDSKADPPTRSLAIWTASPWRWAAAWGSRGRVQTGVAHDALLEEQLLKYAGDKQRSEQR